MNRSRVLRIVPLLAALVGSGVAGGAPADLTVAPAGGRYFAGERLRRTVVVRNLGKEVVCRWATVLLGDQVVEEGTLELTPSDGAVRGEFVTTIPGVTQRLPFTLALRVYADGKVVAERRFEESAFPREPVRLEPARLAKKRVGLFDPSGATARVLTQMQVPFTLLSSLLGLEAFGGEVIVLGEGEALGRAPTSLSQVVERARGGASVLVLAQADWPPRHLRPAWLAGPERPAYRTAQPLSTQGDLLRDLLPGDLREWLLRAPSGPGESAQKASWGALPVPEWGNFRLHLGVPGAGMGASALLEYRVGEGRLLLSTLPVVAAYEQEPAARILMRNLLLLATGPRAPWKRTALWGDPEGDPVRWLRAHGVEAPLNRVNLAEVDVLLVDGSSALSRTFPKHEAEMAQALARFVAGGGRAVILRMTEERLDDYRSVLPAGLTLRRAPVAQVLFARKEPLLWGVPQSALRKVAAERKSILLPEFDRGDKAEALTEPPVISRFRRGRGEVLLVQVPFREDDQGESSRLLSQVLTNLAVPLAEPGR